MKKVPKFFCEYCGTEVRQRDRVCPHCGRFFASVKCPSCGFSGDSHVFKDGCPVCGYAVHQDFSDRKGNGSGKSRRIKQKKSGETDPLPWWIYGLSFGLLVFVIALIIMNAR